MSESASLGVLIMDSFRTSFETLGRGVAVFLPRLVVAVVAFIIIWIVAVMLGRLIEQIVRALKVDTALEGLGAGEPLSRAGYRLDAGAFLGGIVRWFFYVVALFVALDVLNLQDATDFLKNTVLTYIPNVFVAAVMVIAAAVLGDIAQKVVRGSAMAAGAPSASFAGAIAKWAIWIFALLAALYQLDIVPGLIEQLVLGIVAMVALAGGLAFGLGGKEAAAQYIERLRKEMK